MFNKYWTFACIDDSISSVPEMQSLSTLLAIFTFMSVIIGLALVKN